MTICGFLANREIMKVLSKLTGHTFNYTVQKGQITIIYGIFKDTTKEAFNIFRNMVSTANIIYTTPDTSKGHGQYLT